MPQQTILLYNSIMKLRNFSFHLPAEQIARFPLKDRDKSRLMVVNRKTGHIDHYFFRDIIHLLEKDDFMVINHSRVIPVKFFGRINNSGVEILIIKKISEYLVEALTLPARKFRIREKIYFDHDLVAEVVGMEIKGKRILKFNRPYGSILKYGYAPLPPYIKRKFPEARKYKDFDLSRYQTVYSSTPGSIAAPTAGLHFTNFLLEEIRTKIDIFEINLEVGETTFQKIMVQNVEEHKMGKETITIKTGIGEKIKESKKKRQLIAVGTTTVRALETYSQLNPKHETFESELFIYPGFKFKMVDKMITNFHLPESSLFILVSAFAGLELIKEVYQIAIKMDYRFFSYGDAMYII